ncbi:MAG: T9SS type A sorting domain-containing protein [Bacteroidetes bacterium]|nr:T9SS type A sorting domain-containing protein [Bacteroidota bacterium]
MKIITQSLYLLLCFIFSQNSINGKNYNYSNVSTSIDADSDFTMILFPDIQSIVQYNHQTWEKMVNWVRDNIKEKNIKAVIGLGDNTNEPADSEMIEAKKGWDIIDSSGLPYAICIGNHDYDCMLTTRGHPMTRSTNIWNKYFNINNYNKKNWFITAYQDSSQNYCISFPIQSQQYVILILEFYPRNSVLNWAQEILDNITSYNPNVNIIVATHAYLNNDGTWINSGEPKNYGLSIDSNSGLDLWEKFIRKNKNIGLVVCGHEPWKPYFNKKISVNTDSCNIDQLIADYQLLPSNNGNMVLLKFCHGKSFLYAYTYSPNFGSSKSDECIMPWPGSILKGGVPPSTVNLNYPLNGSSISDEGIHLKWSPSVGASAYRLQFSDDSTFTTTILDTLDLSDTTFTVDWLTKSKKYFWRVNSANILGNNSLWSQVFNFSLIENILSDDGTETHPYFMMSQNYPNPFNSYSNIVYHLPFEGKIKLSVYNILGEMVKEIANENKNAGEYEISMNLNNLASGIYFYKMVVHSLNGRYYFEDVKKMVMLK